MINHNKPSPWLQRQKKGPALMDQSLRGRHGDLVTKYSMIALGTSKTPQKSPSGVFARPGLQSKHLPQHFYLMNGQFSAYSHGSSLMDNQPNPWPPLCHVWEIKLADLVNLTLSFPYLSLCLSLSLCSFFLLRSPFVYSSFFWEED